MMLMVSVAMWDMGTADGLVAGTPLWEKAGHIHG